MVAGKDLNQCSLRCQPYVDAYIKMLQTLKFKCVKNSPLLISSIFTAQTPNMMLIYVKKYKSNLLDHMDSYGVLCFIMS